MEKIKILVWKFLDLFFVYCTQRLVEIKTKVVSLSNHSYRTTTMTNYYDVRKDVKNQMASSTISTFTSSAQFRSIPSMTNAFVSSIKRDEEPEEKLMTWIEDNGFMNPVTASVSSSFLKKLKEAGGLWNLVNVLLHAINRGRIRVSCEKFGSIQCEDRKTYFTYRREFILNTTKPMVKLAMNAIPEGSPLIRSEVKDSSEFVSFLENYSYLNQVSYIITQKFLELVYTTPELGGFRDTLEKTFKDELPLVIPTDILHPSVVDRTKRSKIVIADTLATTSPASSGTSSSTTTSVTGVGSTSVVGTTTPASQFSQMVGRYENSDSIVVEAFDKLFSRRKQSSICDYARYAEEANVLSSLLQMSTKCFGDDTRRAFTVEKSSKFNGSAIFAVWSQTPTSKVTPPTLLHGAPRILLEPNMDHSSAVIGTGMLIRDGYSRYLVTCGSVFNPKPFSGTILVPSTFVFTFRYVGFLDGSCDTLFTLKASDIESAIGRNDLSGNWAVLQIRDDITIPMTVTAIPVDKLLTTTPTLMSGTKVTVLGHPQGLPLMQTTGTILTKRGMSPVWRLDITSLGSAANGSPVILEDGTILGLYISGCKTYRPITLLEQTFGVVATYKEWQSNKFRLVSPGDEVDIGDIVVLPTAIRSCISSGSLMEVPLGTTQPFY